MTPRVRVKAWVVLLSLAAAGVVVVRLLLGVQGFEMPGSADVWALRGTRIGAGVIVGVALAVSGRLLQTLLRNPLASPDLLGVSSGAALAVMVVLFLGSHGAVLPAASAWQTAPALMGGMSVLLLLYVLSQRSGVLDPLAVVLMGVMISVFAGAVIMLLRHMMPIAADQQAASTRLLVGALSDDTRVVELIPAAVVVLAGTVFSWAAGRSLDVATLQDDEAITLGVRLHRLRLGLFIAAGAMTAVSVVIAGPIGFVGLVCPHAAVLLVGPRHRPSVLASALTGVILVVGADALVRVLRLPTGRLPLGVVTALVGGPVFIAMLLRQGRGDAGRGA